MNKRRRYQAKRRRSQMKWTMWRLANIGSARWHEVMNLVPKMPFFMTIQDISYEDYRKQFPDDKGVIDWVRKP